MCLSPHQYRLTKNIRQTRDPDSRKPEDNTTMSKYGGFGGSSGKNRGYPTTMKTGPFVKLQGDLERVYSGGSDYGQSIGVKYENGMLVDGILTKRVDKEQFKVLGWPSAPVLFNEDLSCDDLPPVLKETHGTTSYEYEILAARLEADPDDGYDDDTVIRNVAYDPDPDGELDDDLSVEEQLEVLKETTEELPEMENNGPIPLGLIFRDNNGGPEDRFNTWESASEYGPNSAAKTTAKVLTSQGTNAVLDADAKFDWLDEGIILRPELEGMTVTYGKIEKDSNQSDNSFYHVAWEDETGNTILPDNSESPSNGAGSSEKATTDDSTESTSVPEESSTDAEGGVAEFIETCASLEIDTDAAIKGLFADMTSGDEYEITESDVDDVDALVDDVKAQVAAQ